MSEVELRVVSRTNQQIATLPEAEVEYAEWELNADGSMEFSMDPESPGAEHVRFPNEIQLWLDGVLRFQGVPWDIDGDAHSLDVTCEGIGSLFNLRIVDRMSLFYTSIDQLTIAWNILNYAQSEVVELWRDFNIDSWSFGASGIPRSRDYKRDEHKNIRDILDEFDGRKLKNGFDWEFYVDASGARWWRPYSPQKGTYKPNAAMRYDDSGARNIKDFTYSESYKGMATLAYITGGSVTAGGTTIRKEGKYEDVAASAAMQTQMQFLKSEGSQLDEDWLDDRAFQVVQQRKKPLIAMDMTSAIGVDVNLLEEVTVGDTVDTFVDHGRIQIDGQERIYKIRWKKDDTLDVTFGKMEDAAA